MVGWFIATILGTHLFGGSDRNRTCHTDLARICRLLGTCGPTLCGYLSKEKCQIPALYVVPTSQVS